MWQLTASTKIELLTCIQMREGKRGAKKEKEALTLTLTFTEWASSALSLFLTITFHYNNYNCRLLLPLVQSFPLLLLLLLLLHNFFPFSPPFTFNHQSLLLLYRIIHMWCHQNSMKYYYYSLCLEPSSWAWTWAHTHTHRANELKRRTDFSQLTAKAQINLNLI